MQQWIAFAASGAAFVLSGCAGVSTGAYQASGTGSENYDAGIYDRGGLYQPGLDSGGVDEPGLLTGGDGRIDDESL
ncbi:MAG TPA: hypothetical protein VGE72_02115 [Azospirillum sp.]